MANTPSAPSTDTPEPKVPSSSARPRSGWERAGSFLFAWRNWVFTPLLLGVLIAFRPTLLLGSVHADRWLDLAGWALTLGGQGIRLAVIGYSPIQSGGKKKQIAAEQLVTTALHTHCRNPLYLGNLLVLLGLTLIHNNPWVYLLLIPATLAAYMAIVASEEAYLSQRFGTAYAEYQRRTPRCLPRPGLHRSVAGLPFSWKRALFQEYGSIYLAVALPLALMIYQTLTGAPGNPGHVTTLRTALLLCTAAWLAAGQFKRILRARTSDQRYWT